VTPRRILLRAVALVIVALALGGPTPGYVGNCSAGGGADTVERVQFCTDKETYRCARDFAAGRIDGNGYNDCAARIDTTCAGFNFPPGCAPSRALADACISALSDANRKNELDDATHSLPECTSMTLCGAASLEGI
jgi:hypothetical protein